MKFVRAYEANNFTILPNAIFQDKRLSHASLGFLVWFLHLPPGWEVGGIKELAAAKRGTLRHEGRDTTTLCMKELELAGYMTRTRRQCKRTGRWETIIEVRSHPLDELAGQEPAAEVDSVKPQVSPKPGKPGVGQPGPGKPGCKNLKNFHKELKDSPNPISGEIGNSTCEAASPGKTKCPHGKPNNCRDCGTSPRELAKAERKRRSDELDAQLRDKAQLEHQQALARLAATWCGACAGPNIADRWVDDRSARCPACHPLAKVPT